MDIARILGFAINLNIDNDLAQNLTSNSKENKYLLNLENGNFQIIKNYSNKYKNYELIEKELMEKIIKINILQFEELEKIQLSINEVKKLISIMCKFYHFHIGKYFNIESMRLLTE
jgi:hypothetical protein